MQPELDQSRSFLYCHFEKEDLVTCVLLENFQNSFQSPGVFLKISYSCMVLTDIL